MDTCTLESLIRRYLTEELGLENEQIIPIIIQPEIQEGQQILKGIDHWNEMLTQVDKLLLPEYFEDEEIYVSHQAGTPAISSAVQFVSISRSDQIKFLVSNKQQVLDKDLLNENDNKQWKHEAEVIPASQYWREMQIQKARKLLEKGNPAAVLTIIEGLSDINVSDIQEMVNKFNLKPQESQNNDEFEPLAASQRIRESLDLIEIFLENKNYLQAVPLLAAAHEAFLKAGIIYLIQRYIETAVEFPIIGINVFWGKKGLYIKKEKDNAKQEQIKSVLQLSKELWKKYKKFNNSRSNLPNYIVENHDLFDWLKQLILNNLGLASESWIWKNLESTMERRRKYNRDLRNQLIHNLRGIEENDLLSYLKGYFENSEDQEEIEDIPTVFRDKIKIKFVAILSQVFLTEDGESLIENEVKNYLQEELNFLSEKLK